MSPFKFLTVVLYIGYLVNVGLLFVVVPWSQVWGLLLTMLPAGSAAFLDLPGVRAPFQRLECCTCCSSCGSWRNRPS